MLTNEVTELGVGKKLKTDPQVNMKCLSSPIIHCIKYIIHLNVEEMSILLYNLWECDVCGVATVWKTI